MRRTPWKEEFLEGRRWGLQTPMLQTFKGG